MDNIDWAWRTARAAMRGVKNLKHYGLDIDRSTEAIAKMLRKAYEQGRRDGIKDEWKEIVRWKPYLHWCPEWDGLLINKGEPEFDICTCEFPNTSESEDG